MDADVKLLVEDVLRVVFGHLTEAPAELDQRVGEFFYRLEQKKVDCVAMEPEE